MTLYRPGIAIGVLFIITFRAQHSKRSPGQQRERVPACDPERSRGQTNTMSRLVRRDQNPRLPKSRFG